MLPWGKLPSSGRQQTIFIFKADLRYDGILIYTICLLDVIALLQAYGGLGGLPSILKPGR